MWNMARGLKGPERPRSTQNLLGHCLGCCVCFRAGPQGLGLVLLWVGGGLLVDGLGCGGLRPQVECWEPRLWHLFWVPRMVAKGKATC